MKTVAVLSLLATLFWVSVTAGTPVGSWRIYPSFGRPACQVVETDKKVYYVAGGGLFSYDKSTFESIGLTVDHGLSDYYVDFIATDSDDSFLAIIYSGGNIDLLSDDGSVINLPDIKESTSIIDKKVNDIEIVGDRMFVAANFGVVEFDIKKRRVVTYGNYGVLVSAVTVSDGNIYIISEDSLKSVQSGTNLRNIDIWQSVCAAPGVIELAPYGDGKLIGRTDKKAYIFDIATGSSVELMNCMHRFIRNGDKVMINEGNWVGESDALVSLPEKCRYGIVGTADPHLSLWSLSDAGIEGYKRSNNEWQIATQQFRPYAFASNDIGYIIPGTDLSRLYFTNVGLSHYRIKDNDDGIFTYQATSLLSNGEISDVSAYEVMAGNFAAQFLPAQSGHAAATTRLAEDPDNPDTYWLGTGNDGLYKVTAGKYSGRYDCHNSPMGEPYGSRVYEVSFDRSGNMWVGADGKTPTSGIMVLPAAKRRGAISAVSQNDWIVIDTDGFVNEKDIRIFHCKHSDMVFIFSEGNENCFVAYSTAGTPDIFSDDSRRLWKDLIDNDGMPFHPVHFSAIAEDHDGRVWIGTSEGVIEIANPESALTDDFRVRRLKVSHNDGTNLADYLVGTDLVLDIAVDGANRKWLATESSGVYLTDVTGSSIINHFTADNSPLPSQRVNAVQVMSDGNSVFFATDSGVLEYGSDAAEAAPDLSSIRVYPNPVTPDYGGDVTIDRLTDGALVKIADSGGSVIWQKKAEGGMLTWNICDSSGRRVRSGIYFVIVSVGNGEGSGAATAKIAVVN